MKVLIITSHYLPGFKAGGPIRSVANLVARLGDEFDFRIVARDRDVGDTVTFAGVQPNKWQHVGGALVSYVRPSFAAPFHVARAIGGVRPDVLYLNSFFDAPWCLSPLSLARCGALPRTPIIIAPRGQFAIGALRFKSTQKKLYLAALRSLGLTKRIIWQATSDIERDDIHRVVGREANVAVAPNLCDVRAIVASRAPKRPGRLHLAFFSRVSAKKNLLGAIEILSAVSGNVTCDIWGPVEDAAYERRCRQLIAALPANIEVRWRGPVAPEAVADTLAHYDAMLLPTFGENFGHAIIEALAAGCPVVISDRTPWRGLESQGVGWDVPLDCPRAFRQALETLSQMDERAHERMRTRATHYATAAVGTPDHVEAHRRLFQLALGSVDRSRERLSPQAA